MKPVSRLHIFLLACIAAMLLVTGCLYLQVSFYRTAHKDSLLTIDSISSTNNELRDSIRLMKKEALTGRPSCK